MSSIFSGLSSGAASAGNAIGSGLSGAWDAIGSGAQAAGSALADAGSWAGSQASSFGDWLTKPAAQAGGESAYAPSNPGAGAYLPMRDILRRAAEIERERERERRLNAAVALMQTGSRMINGRRGGY